jgi:DNA-directed RNA polymerase specialized sigma24 family protein
MEPDFDLDVTFEEQANEQLVSSMSSADLAKAIAKLPPDISAAAHAILVDKRTYSDVSQALGLRQPELVRAVHRAKLLISESK